MRCLLFLLDTEERRRRLALFFKISFALFAALLCDSRCSLGCLNTMFVLFFFLLGTRLSFAPGFRYLIDFPFQLGLRLKVPMWMASAACTPIL